jgi:hypothetical protein
MDIPVHTKEDIGTFHYPKHLSKLSEARGFFSFSFYIRDDDSVSLTAETGFGTEAKGTSLYLLGLLAYLEVCESEEFNKWMALVYTDRVSYEKITDYNNKPFHIIKQDILESLPGKLMTSDQLRTRFQQLETNVQLIKEIFKRPTISFVIVDLNRHERKNGEMVGTIVRCMRHRAPFDFPNHIVLIRDLDTLFEKRLANIWSVNDSLITETNTYEKLVEENQARFNENLKQWEHHFLKKIPDMQALKQSESLLIVANGEPRQWHKNENRVSPFGLYAGFVNIVPPVPVFQTNELWDIYMDWLSPRNKKVNTRSKLNMEYISDLVTKGKLTAYPGKDPFYLTYTGKPTHDDLAAYKDERLGKIRNNTRRQLRKNYMNAKETNTFAIFSNDADDTKIGRDEQYLIFLLVPRCLREVVFVNISKYDKISGERKFLQITELPAFPDLHEYHAEQFTIFTEALRKGFKGGSRRKRKIKKANKTVDKN